jgi:hypothetical protein
LGISSGASDLVTGDASGDAVFRKPASSGAFRFSVDGGTSSAFTILSNGKVGVGTGTPDNSYQGLTISGTDPSLRLKTTSGSGWVWTEYVTSAGVNNFSMGVNQTIPYFGIKAGAGLDNPNFAIVSSGNVLIGTTTDGGRKLEVQTSSTTAALWVQTGGTTSAYTIADFRTGTNLPALQILGNGEANFGSSVTTGSTLQANGNAFILPTLSGGGAGGGLYLGVYPDTQYTKQAILVERYVGVNGNYGRGSLHFCNRDTADANQPTLADSRMVITSAGNVGIGTASPNANLDIQRVAGDSNDILRLGSNQNYYFGFSRNTSNGALQIQGNQTGNNNISLAPTSGSVGIGTASPNTALDVRLSGSVAYSAANLSAYQGVFISNQGTGGFANISLNTFDATQGFNCTTAISAVSETSGTRNSSMTFATRQDSSQNIIERMRINSSGIVTIGKSVDDGAVTSGCEFRPQGFGYFTRTDGESLIINRKSSNGIQVQFRRDNNDVGNISSTTAVTSYNVTSDYRLKEDLQEINGLEKVQAINVYNYKWKSEDSRMDGVLAHELAEILPYAVQGEKDAVDEDGKDKMQCVDYSKIVPILIKAIQEQQQQIDKLKNA